MDRRGIKGDEPKAKSFRHESYDNRRVFLRSYPLQWKGEQGGYSEEDHGESHRRKQSNQTEEEDYQETREEDYPPDAGNQKRPMKKVIISVFHWGEEKFLFLKRIKDMFTVHVIACIPVSFRRPTALLSA